MPKIYKNLVYPCCISYNKIIPLLFYFTVHITNPQQSPKKIITKENTNFIMNIDLTKTQQYLDWLKEKLYLNHIALNAQKRLVYRGEVYRCKFGIGIGSEECKERPCVILQCNPANSASPNTIVAPITHTNAKLAVVVPIAPKKDTFGKVILDGNVLLGNITCISKARLGSLITKLSKEEMNAVDIAIAKSLGIHERYQSLENKYNDQVQHIQKLNDLLSEYKNAVDKTNCL